MLAFPVHPRYARMLLAAQDYGCVRPVALIAALTQGRDLLARRQGKHARRRTRRAVRWRERVGFLCADARLALRRAKRLSDRPLPAGGYKRPSRAPGRAALRTVFAHRGGRRIGHRRKAAGSRRRAALSAGRLFPTISPNGSTPARSAASWCTAGAARLARESVVKAPLFVVAEVREVESGGGRERNLNVVLNLATAVKEDWLREMFPQGFHGNAGGRLRSRAAARRCPRGETISRSASGRKAFRPSAGRRSRRDSRA